MNFSKLSLASNKLLLDGDPEDKELLQLSMIELLQRKGLAIKYIPSQYGGVTNPITCMARGEDYALYKNDPLFIPLLAPLREYPRMEVKAYMQEISVSGYRNKYVVTSLARHGLMRNGLLDRWMGLERLTPKGEAYKKDLKRTVKRLREYTRRHIPEEEAAPLVAALGASVVLVGNDNLQALRNNLQLDALASSMPDMAGYEVGEAFEVALALLEISSEIVIDVGLDVVAEVGGSIIGGIFEGLGSIF